MAKSTGTSIVCLESRLKPSGTEKIQILPFQSNVVVHCPRSEPDGLIKQDTSIGSGNIENTVPDLWREMEVLIKRGLDAMTVLATCTSNPAKRLGLNKGNLNPGTDADFILLSCIGDKSLANIISTAPYQTPLVASFVGGLPVWMDPEFSNKWQSANIALYSSNGVTSVETLNGTYEFDSIESALDDFGKY